MYIGYFELGNFHPTFDTIPLPFNGLYKGFAESISNSNKGGMDYMINENLQDAYNPNNRSYDKVKDRSKLKGHSYYITGDPYKDTTTLILKK